MRCNYKRLFRLIEESQETIRRPGVQRPKLPYIGSFKFLKQLSVNYSCSNEIDIVKNLVFSLWTYALKKSVHFF